MVVNGGGSDGRCRVLAAIVVGITFTGEADIAGSTDGPCVATAETGAGVTGDPSPTPGVNL